MYDASLYVIRARTEPETPADEPPPFFYFISCVHGSECELPSAGRGVSGRYSKAAMREKQDGRVSKKKGGEGREGVDGDTT